jgi:hypothetical protein
VSLTTVLSLSSSSPFSGFKRRNKYSIQCKTLPKTNRFIILTLRHIYIILSYFQSNTNIVCWQNVEIVSGTACG